MREEVSAQTMKTRDHAGQEPHSNRAGSRMNWLRASVLGANDGIVLVAGLVVGVAGATDSRAVIFTAGLAGLISGALSMAAGEYVSVAGGTLAMAITFLIGRLFGVAGL